MLFYRQWHQREKIAIDIFGEWEFLQKGRFDLGIGERRSFILG